jgi:LysR family glycine cleavage system transcriptional activator
MRKLYPQMPWLRSFVVTARHGSISRAAVALHLTQGAVSKQIMELEQSLGVALFTRARKRQFVSAAGQRYLPAVQAALAQTESATLELLAHGNQGRALHVYCVPTFAAKWVIPRMVHLNALHTSITVDFVHTSRAQDFNGLDLDCAIRYGNGDWQDASSDYLAGREVVLIAPSKPNKGAALRQRADIAKHTLLHHFQVPDAWPQWCLAQGLSAISTQQGPVLDNYNSLIRAVMAGLGLALVPACLVREEIEAGLVSAPLAAELVPYQTMTGYFLCCPRARTCTPALTVFRQWLLDEAKADAMTNVLPSLMSP